MTYAFSTSEIMNMSLSKFKLIKKIGYGAYGKVWLANYINNGKLYALKFIDKYKGPLDIETASDLGTTINHPNLMKLHYYFFENLKNPQSMNSTKYIIFIMEYIEGNDLYSKVKQGKTLDLDIYILNCLLYFEVH